MRCDGGGRVGGGWRRWRRGWRVTRGSRKPPGIYVRRSFASLTIRGASALTALRQQAGVVETYNEKIMNPVHRVCLECEPGCRSLLPLHKSPLLPALVSPATALPTFSILRLCLFPIPSSFFPSSFFFRCSDAFGFPPLYRVACWSQRIFRKRVSFAISADEKKEDFAFHIFEDLMSNVSCIR